ncbi:MAG TPA: aminoglycoside phosphotransferase family protein [Amycolatopsis sp.]|uniref:phosphotransferase enzyme family protein n=1 Tax=Amycolatopsis sp. TaxID=37632 RepID=UPI002B4A307B|nr:aminoglycoside phosphotransferase family protein [Amycolatopsis sp.]HKS48769.1 aminoglycoside phosphotransferase family protein [Amycolatopsis sp.]
MTEGPATFTPERTQAVLEAACQAQGLDASDAALLRFGENAIYRLRQEPVVVRVGRSVEAASKEVHVARWLDLHGFPAARLALDQDPVVVGGIPVTFWEYIPENPTPITPAEFGKLLHDLHALPAPTDFRLPDFQPMPKTKDRLENIPTGYLSESDLAFFQSRYDEISAEFEKLDFVLPPGPIHCDAHPGNLLRGPDGTLNLIDFEDFAYGPREWDAAVLSVRHQAFGWASEAEYRAYVDAYGFDPISWPGFPVIRAARELNMTTWLAQMVGDSPEIEAEVRKRVADLRDEQGPRNWRAF